MREVRLVTPAFAVVTASALAYFTAIGMLLPAVPRYVQDELGGGGAAVGVAVGAFAVSAAMLRPLVGRVGDTRGRRLLVLVGTASVGISVLAYGLGTNLASLVVLRLISGAGEAAVFVGAATASQDMAPPERRGEAASYFSVAIYGGIALGPVLGEYLRSEQGFGAVWLAAAACCAVAFALGWWVPSGPSNERRPSGGERRPLLHGPALGPGLVLLLGLIGLAGFGAFMPLYVDDLGMDKADLVFAVYALVILGVRILAGRAPDRLGPVRAVTMALVGAAGGLLLMGAWASRAGLFTATVVFALGMAFLYPALFPIVVGRAAEHERSHAIGTFSLFFDLSQGFGAPMLGLVVALSGERGAFIAGAVASLAALAVFRATTARDVGEVSGVDAVPAGEPPPTG